MNNTAQQPKALYLLFFVQMWECFSYYGMRILLVLYMSQVLGFGDSQAFGVFAIYCALVEFGGIFGGRLADQIIGQRAAIMLGGWLIAFGHISMLFGEAPLTLYFSLGLIATGTGLFSSNISSLLGQYYEENDPRREEGYTLFYIGINVGAILATLCCGLIAENYGWHTGFGIAALGMLFGNGALLWLDDCLEEKGRAPINVSKRSKCLIALGIGASLIACVLMLSFQEIMMRLLPLACVGAVLYAGRAIYSSRSMAISKIIALGAYLTVLTVFYAAEEQIGSSMMLFAERQGSGNILGIPLPTSLLMGVNPLIIICFGVVVSKAAGFLKLDSSTRLTLGCILSAVAFAGLSICAGYEMVSLFLIVLLLILISIGELLVGPTVYAFFSESAPQKLQGLTMGLIPIGYSMASVLSGFFSQSMASEVEGASQELYSLGFQRISWLLLATGILLYLLKIIQNRRTKEVYGIS